MNARQPETITLSACREAILNANGAYLFVEVEGASLFLGRAVLQQSREVRKLAEALAEVGVQASDIFVQSARADVKSGFISKSTTANYRLRIHCQDLDTLPAIMDRITDRKEARLTEVEWRYPSPDEVHDSLLGEALRIVKARAELVATELELSVLGVYKLNEELSDPENQEVEAVQTADHFYVAQRQHGVGSEPGIEIQHSKEVKLTVTVQFKVEALAEKQST